MASALGEMGAHEDALDTGQTSRMSFGSSGAAVHQKGQSQATRREAVAALGAAAVAALGGTDEADIAGGGSVQEDLIDAVADKRFEFLEGVREHRQLLRVQLRDSFANWATRVSATAR